MDIIGIYSDGYGSGKDSTASVFALNFGYVVYGFSEVLKEQIFIELIHKMFVNYNLWLEYCETHKYDDENQSGFWVRKLLQGYGQFYRSINPNYWVELWEKNSKSRDYTKLAVPSVRFPNEATRIKELGGSLIKVIRPGIPVDPDPSELSMKNWVPDYEIYNDGSLQDLVEKVKLFMRNENNECNPVPSQLVQEKSPVF